MRNARIISAAIIAACLCSCVHKTPVSLPNGNPIFPAEFVITQHILWKFRGKDYDFVSDLNHRCLSLFLRSQNAGISSERKSYFSRGICDHSAYTLEISRQGL